MPNPENLTPHNFTSLNQPENRKSRKGVPNRSTVLKKWLSVKKEIKNPITGKVQKGTLEDEIALALLQEARTGSVAAFREIMDTVYGKQSEKVEIGNTEGEEFKTACRVILPKVDPQVENE